MQPVNAKYQGMAGFAPLQYTYAMEAEEIFDLIVRADEKLKYATGANADLRRKQARELLGEALAAARDAGNDALASQAEFRLLDLDTSD